MEGWASAGVNRISLGIQSFSDRELAAVGRRHDANGARAAIRAITQAGISVSGDLILDEFAFHEDANAIWNAAEPILSSNADYLCRIASTPNGKLATPESIADAVVFLASSRADMITGTTLPVDGGWTAW